MKQAMEFCRTYNFDPECTVILKGVRTECELEDVQRAFGLLDDVVKVQYMEGFSHTILCQFSDPISPKLLDSEHPVDGTFWEVIQVDDFCPAEPEGQCQKEQVVPLGRAIGNMTLNFQEQVNELALTYNISPATLNQVALNSMSTKTISDSGPLFSSPALAVKSQTPPEKAPVASFGAESAASSSHVTSVDPVLINPLPADIQRVVVELVVKHDSSFYVHESCAYFQAILQNLLLRWSTIFGDSELSKC